MGVIAEMADDVIVMYLGKEVEVADVDTIFHSPSHPYTQALLRSIPRHDVERDVATSVLSVDQRSMSPRIEPDDPLGRLTRFFGFKSSWKLVPDESVVVHV